MQGKPSPDSEQVDSAVLGLLLAPDSERPWSDEEIAREIGDKVETTDSLARLAGAGLVHRLKGFSWASRAALHGDALRL